jgi:hypothetical protein
LLSPNDLDREHLLDIQLRDADGKMIANAQGQLKVPKSEETPAGWKQAVILPLRFFNVPFVSAGHYLFEILINNVPTKSIPLRLLQTPT